MADSPRIQNWKAVCHKVQPWPFHAIWDFVELPWGSPYAGNQHRRNQFLEKSGRNDIGGGWGHVVSASCTGFFAEERKNSHNLDYHSQQTGTSRIDWSPPKDVRHGWKPDRESRRGPGGDPVLVRTVEEVLSTNRQSFRHPFELSLGLFGGADLRTLRLEVYHSRQ